MVLTSSWMTEIANEQINQTIIIQITETGADCMAADWISDSACIVDHSVRDSVGRRFFGDIIKPVLAIVSPQKVWLQTIIGNVDINISILIEIGCSNTPCREVFGRAPHFGEALASVIQVDDIRVYRLLPNFISSHVQIKQAVIVDIDPYCTS